MKALPTTYGAVAFRSRTEARWAVFFDAMGIKWTYEDQGYKLDGGATYLPDFRVRVPAGEYFYVEVKPDNFDKFEVSNAAYLSKLHAFSRESGCRLLVVDGSPAFKPYDIVSGALDSGSLHLAFWQDYDPYVRIADAYWLQYVQTDKDGKMWINADERAIQKAFGSRYVGAINQSRAEKFGL